MSLARNLSKLAAFLSSAGQTQAAGIADGAVTYAKLSSDVQGDMNQFKNRIINGEMRIDQRNAGSMVSITTGETYSVDRWFARFNAGSFTATQGQSTVAPTGFKNSFLVNVTTGGTISAATRGTVLQRVEGYNWADMGYGAAGASTCTLSFWVRSSLTGTFSGGLSNSAGDRSYVFTYTISAANTWEFKTITIAGDTTGTWVGATNGIGFSLSWDLGNGSDLKTSTTGSWIAGDYRGATGSVAPLGSSGATWYITGVQLEKGSTATSFDYRPYGTELALCQRYCFAARPVNNGAIIGLGQAYNATTAIIGVNIPVSMRSTPTATRNGLSVWNASVGSDLAVSSISIADGTPSFVRLDVTVASGLSAGNAAFLNGTASPSNTGYLILSSEL